MKTLFILGAGASKQAGAPLMNDFLDRAADLVRTRHDGVWSQRDRFEDVFEAIAELGHVYNKSYLDLDNIESVFGAIEMGRLLGKLGGRDKASIEELRESLITVIYKTLEYSIYFPVTDRGIVPPNPYDRFIKMLKDVNRDRPVSGRHSYSFVTFNYDLCLDFTLIHNSLGYEYFLSPSQSSDTIPLLKLHGSISWGNNNDGNIEPIPVNPSYFSPGREYSSIPLDFGSMLSYGHFREKGILGPPVIIPPTWNKNNYPGQLPNVWTKAAEEMAAAENIFVIGYSLPETDSFFRYLYALGSQSATRIRHFAVINLDDSGETERKYRALIGRGIESRFTYRPATFEDSIDWINSILTNL